eukprot:6465395-Amphidinium_carterae.1
MQARCNKSFDAQFVQLHNGGEQDIDMKGVFACGSNSNWQLGTASNATVATPVGVNAVEDEQRAKPELCFGAQTDLQ